VIKVDPKSLPRVFLETPEDVKSFLKSYPDFTTKSEARKWLSFAKHNKLVKPPILSLLPEKFTLEVLAIREDYAKSFLLDKNVAKFGQLLTTINDEVLENLLELSLNLPEDYLEMANEAVKEGKEILKTISGKTRYKSPDLPSSRLSSGIFELPEIISILFFYYLNRRDTRVKAYIKETFLKMLLYDDALLFNKKLVRNLKDGWRHGDYQVLSEKLHYLFCFNMVGIFS